MPKDTFLNLAEEKKERIFRAAVQEFSNCRFSEASINQIVKNAGISRGSFYQYFDDKEDIYLYMITEIGKEKMEVLNKAQAFDSDSSFFEAYMHMYRVGLKWAQEKPEYNRIFMLMDIDDTMANLGELSAEGFAILRHLLERDKERGLIKQEVDSDLVVEMVYELMKYSFKEYYQKKKVSVEEMEEKIAGLLDIIRDGIANQDQGY